VESYATVERAPLKICCKHLHVEIIAEYPHCYFSLLKGFYRSFNPVRMLKGFIVPCVKPTFIFSLLFCSVLPVGKEGMLEYLISLLL
jgi:hypothetical protein